MYSRYPEVVDPDPTMHRIGMRPGRTDPFTARDLPHGLRRYEIMRCARYRVAVHSIYGATRDDEAPDAASGSV